MPKLPIDYSKTIIYKIVCRDLGISNCYVGHTTDFMNRKRQHKSCCKTETAYVYKFIRETGGWENWDMIMVEKYHCKDIIEACARERHWIETLGADLNQRNPPTGLSRNENNKVYYQINKEEIQKQNSEYYKNHSEEICQKKSEYYNNNTKEILIKQKEYYKTHKEQHAKRCKEYATIHKDEIKARKSRKVCCVLCKTLMTFDNLTRHYKRLH